MSTSAHPSSLATDDWIVSLAMESSFNSANTNSESRHQQHINNLKSICAKPSQQIHRSIPFETIMPRSGAEALLRCCNIFCGVAGGGFGYESIRGASSSDQSSTTSDERKRARRRRKRLKSSARKPDLDESGTSHSDCDSTSPQSDHVGVPRTIRIDANLSPTTPDTGTTTNTTASTSLGSPQSHHHPPIPNTFAGTARQTAYYSRGNHSHPRGIVADSSLLNQWQKPIPEDDSTGTKGSNKRRSPPPSVNNGNHHNASHNKMTRRILAICLGTLAIHILLLVASKTDNYKTTNTSTIPKPSIPEPEISQPVFGGATRKPPTLQPTKPSYKYYKPHDKSPPIPEPLYMIHDPPSPASSYMFTTESPFCKAFFNFEPTTKTMQQKEPGELIAHAINEIIHELKNALMSHWVRALNKAKRLLKKAQIEIIACVQEQCI